MFLLSERDMKHFSEECDNIMQKADQERYKRLKPTLKDMWDIIHTVRDFVIEKRRKIYGGFALNKLIESVSPEKKFYDDDDVEKWDIDFYSPDPIADGIEITERLYKKGYKYIVAGEALHEETYKIHAEMIDVADITYMPSNIYNRVQFVAIENMCLTHPHFMMIDYFRVITDPLTSYFRLEKTMGRLKLLAESYPLPVIKHHNEKKGKKSDNHVMALDAVEKFIESNTSVVVVGTYAVNEMAKKVGCPGVPHEFYEIVSVDFLNDAPKLINAVRKEFGNAELITHAEFHPFFQYLGRSVAVSCDDKIVCKMYSNDERCVPFNTIKTNEKKNVQLGSYITVMMYNLINIIKARCDNDTETKKTYMFHNSELMRYRNIHVTKKGGEIHDSSLFNYFVIRCVGETALPKRRKQERIESNKAAGKRYVFRYEPRGGTPPQMAHQFKNSSGNVVRKPKDNVVVFDESERAMIEEKKIDT